MKTAQGWMHKFLTQYHHKRPREIAGLPGRRFSVSNLTSSRRNARNQRNIRKKENIKRALKVKRAERVIKIRNKKSMILTRE